jgi:hypothetical protein
MQGMKIWELVLGSIVVGGAGISITILFTMVSMMME